MPHNPSAPVGSNHLSRRRLLELSAAAGLTIFGAAACSTRPEGNATTPPGAGPGQTAQNYPPPNGILGANFNGDPSIMSWEEIEQAGATWIRGFTAMPDLDKEKPAENRAIKTLLEAVDRKHGTVLSLKFPYFPRSHKQIPRPGTEEMKADLARLDKVLPTVMDKVDILVIGNEPFIECPEADWNNGAINDFYETVAAHVIKYRAENFPGKCKTVLYMGSFNNLDDPKWTGKGTERWMRYVRDTPEIAGTDIHPHVAHPEDPRKYLDYVLPKLGDKKFLVTEFSLVKLWGDHLKDPISAEYAAKYQAPKDTKVWQVIKNALNEPFPKERWYDFLRTSSWFEGNKTFLSDQMKLYRDTGKLAVATYGIGQDAAMAGKDFGPDSTPWLLNSLFASATIKKNADGSAVPNYAWIDEFKALQKQ